jgi:hypothetical protein
MLRNDGVTVSYDLSTDKHAQELVSDRKEPSYRKLSKEDCKINSIEPVPKSCEVVSL